MKIKTARKQIQHKVRFSAKSNNPYYGYGCTTLRQFIDRVVWGQIAKDIVGEQK